MLTNILLVDFAERGRFQKRFNATRSTFISDGFKAWNLAPESIKNSATYNEAKSEIKKFEKAIPI